MDSVTTICYGEKRIWNSRMEAEEFFLMGICNSEGSEQERYVSVYSQLQAGDNVCSDLF